MKRLADTPIDNEDNKKPRTECHDEARKKPEWIEDLTLFLHSQIVKHGVYAFLDLLNWHKTCRRFYNAWCDVPRLKALLTEAVKKALVHATLLSNAIRTPGQGHRTRELTRILGQVMRLEQVILTVALARAVWDHLVPSASDAADYTGWVIGKPGIGSHDHSTISVVYGCLEPADAYELKNGEINGLRLQWAFSRLSSCMEQFYAWTVSYRRKQRDETFREVTTTESLRTTDLVCLYLSSSVYPV